MKVNQIVKAVATVTTLGVFLAGCSGGDATQSRAASTPNTNTNTPTLPNAGSTPTVGGGGTVTVGGNAVIDDIAAKQAAQDAKLDQILAEAKSANKNAKSAKTKSNWAMWIGGGVAAAIAAGAIANGIREARSEDKDGGFFGGLFGSHTGQNGDIAKKAADKAVIEMGNRLDKTDEKVANTKDTLDKGLENMGEQVGLLQVAAGANIVATLNNLKATGALGAKAEQLLKGQDGLAKELHIVKANEEVIKGNTEAIKVSSAKILSSQDESSKNQAAMAETIAVMTQQLAQAETSRKAIKASLDAVVSNTSDETVKKQLQIAFADYKKSMDVSIDAAKGELMSAIAKSKVSQEDIALAIAKMVPSSTEIASQVANQMRDAKGSGSSQAPVVINFNTDKPIGKENMTLNQADTASAH